MVDIVEWLRNAASEHNMYRCEEAADEIERLREALKLVRDELDRRRKNAEEARKEKE